MDTYCGVEVQPGQIMGVDTIAEEQCSTHLVGIGNFLVWTQGKFNCRSNNNLNGHTREQSLVCNRIVICR